MRVYVICGSVVVEVAWVIVQALPCLLWAVRCNYASLRVFCGEDIDIICVNTGWGLLHPAATPASASTSLRLASSADKGGQRDSHHSFRT